MYMHLNVEICTIKLKYVCSQYFLIIVIANYFTDKYNLKLSILEIMY